MRRILTSAAALAAACIALPASAATLYDFSGLTAGTVPAAAETPPAPGVSYQGSYTYGTPPTGIGAIGPDRWVWASSTANFFSSVVRNDAQLGMNGNYIASYTVPANTATGAAPASYDTINSRVNPGGATLGLTTGQKFRVGFTANISGINYTNASAVATTTSSRAEMALGYDQNGDGDIRGDSMNLENMEWGPMFGYEPLAGAGSAGLTGKFYVRPASLGTAVQVNANGPGVYRFELEVDPTANPVAATANNYAGNDGKGTLYVQQLFDSTGLPVSDTLHAVTGLVDINLGLTRMTQHNSTNVGTINGWDPAYWNGFFTRLSNNGMMDDVTLTVLPEPASLATLAIGGAALLRRRKQA